MKALPVLLPSAVEVHLAPEVRPIVLAETVDEAGTRFLSMSPIPPPSRSVYTIAGSPTITRISSQCSWAQAA